VELKLGQFVKQIRNSWKVSKCGVGEGWRSVGPIVWYMKGKKANWIDHILPRNCYLKQVIDGKMEGSIDVTGRRGKRCKQLLNVIRK
jgi:hypothetical protein